MRSAFALPAALVLLSLCLPWQKADAQPTLWQALASEPNLVVFMRHTNASGGQPLKWDASGLCEGEMVLTDRGHRQAEQIGAAFARRGVKPGAVISSPMCRCSETARLAFGERFETAPELREIASADLARSAEFERTAQALIASHLGRAPVIFVSHRPNVEVLTLELIDEEELLVTRATRRGDFDVLGRIRMQP